MALDLAQLQSLIDTATTADAFKKDVQRALKKISANLNALQASLDEANELLSGDYTPTSKERKARTPRAAKAPKELGEVDPEAPFGRKKDGTPAARRGRVKSDE